MFLARQLSSTAQGAFSLSFMHIGIFHLLQTRLQSSGSQVGLFRGLYSGVGSRMAGVIPDWIACYTG
jgi:hypothetical protein